MVPQIGTPYKTLFSYEKKKNLGWHDQMAPQIKPKQICIQMGKKNATCLGGGGGCMKILVACSMKLKVNGNEPLRKIRRP